MGDLNLAFEPAWPWSIPHVGLPAMLGVALLLIALTVWTYTGVRKATWRRVGVVLLLRLAALVIAFLAVLRPSLGVTHLEGVETSKLLVIVDQSVSMTVPDMPGSATRWQHLKRLWESRAVKSRLEQLAAEQKIEVMAYLGAADLRPFDPNADADGERTDIGAWLNQLRQSHGQEKHLRGIMLFSDGADNGTRFSLQEEAGRWRGVCPVTAFGVGNPNDPKFRKSIALTNLEVEPSPVAVKSNMAIRATVEAAGLENAPIKMIVSIEDADKNPVGPDLVADVTISGKKAQVILVNAVAPQKQGEYKITAEDHAAPADEANLPTTEISTYVQVIKEKIKILWVDRPRVYEQIAAIRAINTDPRFEVQYLEKPVGLANLQPEKCDLLVIGDIAAERFSGGKNEVFAAVAERVRANMGLLMLGGETTFGAGGWQAHHELMELLPVEFPSAGFTEAMRVRPVKKREEPFLQLVADPTANAELWNKTLEPLEGIALMKLKAPGEMLMEGEKGELVMAARVIGRQRVVVFAGDSTAKTWLTPETIGAYQAFWKRLALWTSGQQDDGKLLWITLDKRRINAGIGETLGFKFGLKDKKGNELPKATFPVLKVIGPKQQEFVVTPIRDPGVAYQRGVFQGATELGEYKVVIDGTGKDPEDKIVSGHDEARFLVVRDDIEKLRPGADHETLHKIALASGGRFFTAEEAPLLAYLDELKYQVNAESRHKTTQWPDWNRLPASDHARDQLAGLWSSFALGGFLLFTVLLGGEWLLRRMWGLV